MDAVVYQIYPRSFCDTTGDGVGDLEGIVRHLDHLSWLGVDALWLSPIFPSPMVDHGYDVADYCDVDPVFGSLAVLDRLVAEAHHRDLRVLLDWVPNHTSDQHPWFAASRSSRDDPKRDWYLWVEGSPDEVPNGWRCAFPPGPAWTWDDTSGAWYYHRYTPGQPDLNWENPEVVAAMHDTLRFWLDRGVDGFRIDVAHQLGKDLRAALRTGAGSPVVAERTREHLRGIREVVDGYPDRVAVGEVYILDVDRVATYVGDGQEPGTGPLLNLAFNFVPMWLPWEAEPMRIAVESAMAAFGSHQAPPTWVLGSHDMTRLRTRLGVDGSTADGGGGAGADGSAADGGGDGGGEAGARRAGSVAAGEDVARAAALLLLGLEGAAFVYAGEELGLEDAVVPPERQTDPAGIRDGCRAPIPWDATPAHGWGTDDPWLPWPPEPEVRNAAVLGDDPGSILHLYRRMLEARRASPALRTGGQALLDTHEDVLAWSRTTDGDRRVVAVNFHRDEPRPLLLGADRWRVELASDGVGEGTELAGELGPAQAVVLRPL
jgi:alpha-glucosidase